MKKGNTVFASSLLGLFFTFVTIFFVLFCNFQLLPFTDIEPPVNCWTWVHLVFGLSIAFIAYSLINLKGNVVTVSFFVLVLWEFFEYKEYPVFWVRNLINNVMDIIIGLVGVLFSSYLLKKIEERE